jgi:hypothetical protein
MGICAHREADAAPSICHSSSSRLVIPRA